jgi:hypothetical protein
MVSKPLLGFKIHAEDRLRAWRGEADNHTFGVKHPWYFRLDASPNPGFGLEVLKPLIKKTAPVVRNNRTLKDLKGVILTTLTSQTAPF